MPTKPLTAHRSIVMREISAECAYRPGYVL